MLSMQMGESIFRVGLGTFYYIFLCSTTLAINFLELSLVDYYIFVIVFSFYVNRSIVHQQNVIVLVVISLFFAFSCIL